MLFPFVNHPNRDITGWLPWDFRLLRVPPINSWSPMVHQTVTVLWNCCCHIVHWALNTQGPACTCVGVTFFPDWTLSFTWIGTFLCVHSFPTLPVILQTCHSFKSFQTEESFGPSCLQRQESSSLMADIKENTCSLETHLRPSNSLNNPPCPSPSDNTHLVLRHHYLQSEMTRHNPNAGRSF